MKYYSKPITELNFPLQPAFSPSKARKPQNPTPSFFLQGKTKGKVGKRGTRDRREAKFQILLHLDLILISHCVKINE
jgi:hypothetical protein